MLRKLCIEYRQNHLQALVHANRHEPLELYCYDTLFEIIKIVYYIRTLDNENNNKIKCLVNNYLVSIIRKCI